MSLRVHQGPLPELGEAVPAWPLQQDGNVFVRRTPWTGGEPALFVHGLGGGSTNWTDLMGLLADQLDGEAVDLPGFGHSPPPTQGRYRLSTHAKAVIALLERRGRGPVHLFGNSLGGAVSTRVAAWRPDLVKTLTLISPALPNLRPKRGTDPRLALLLLPGLSGIATRRMAKLSPEQRARAVMELCYGDPSKVHPRRLAEAAAEVTRRTGLAHNDAAFMGSLRGLVSVHLQRGERGLWRQAATVQAPTLLVWGDRDRLVDPALAPRAARTFPDSRLLMLEGVGHVAQMEAAAGGGARLPRHAGRARGALGGPLRLIAGGCETACLTYRSEEDQRVDDYPTGPLPGPTDVPGLAPGTGPVSERMRALLARAVDDQVAEQRAVTTMLSDLREQVSALGEALARTASGAGVERVAGDVAALAAELRTATAGLSSRLEGLGRRVDAQAELLEASGQGDELGARRLVTLTDDVAASSQLLEQLSARVEQLAQFPAAVSALQADVAGVHDRLAPLADLRAAVDELGSRTGTDALRSELEELRARVEALPGTADLTRSRDAVVEALSGRLERLEALAGRPSVTPEALQDAVGRLSGQLEELPGRSAEGLTGLDARLGGLEARLDELGQQVAAVGETAGGVPALTGDLSRVATRVEALPGLRADLTTLQEDLTALREEAAAPALTLGLAALREDVGELAAEVRGNVPATPDAVAAAVGARVDRLVEGLAPQVAEAVLSRVGPVLVERVSADVARLVTAEVTEIVRGTSVASERRVLAHVDEAVLALADALLRRRRAAPRAPEPVVPAAAALPEVSPAEPEVGLHGDDPAADVADGAVVTPAANGPATEPDAPGVSPGPGPAAEPAEPAEPAGLTGDDPADDPASVLPANGAYGLAPPASLPDELAAEPRPRVSSAEADVADGLAPPASLAEDLPVQEAASAEADLADGLAPPASLADDLPVQEVADDAPAQDAAEDADVADAADATEAAPPAPAGRPSASRSAVTTSAAPRPERLRAPAGPVDEDDFPTVHPPESSAQTGPSSFADDDDDEDEDGGADRRRPWWRPGN